MARMARLVIPDLPHHVTQRGNRRQPTFFRDDDFIDYLRLLGAACHRSQTEVWAYCLMPNHVHFVMVPASEDGLRDALADAHRRYTRAINHRFGWRGHLWQERFHSAPMDERHLHATVRYVEQNPVAAGLAPTAEAWPWSSVHAHLRGHDDALVKVSPMLQRIEDWAAYVARSPDQDMVEAISKHTRTGRPLGDQSFVNRTEQLTRRKLAPRKPGRRLRDND